MTKPLPPLAAVLLAGVVAGFAAAGAAPAQAPPAAQQPEFGEKIQVSEVLIDALVTDASGDVVLGLGKNEFIVEEDGKPVTVNDVAFYSNRRFLDASDRAKALGVAPGEVPADRYFVLFFDDPRTVLPRLAVQQLDAGRRAEQWARTELLPNDYVAVAGYNFRLKVYSDFSSDPEKVVAGIENAMVGKEIDDYGARPAGDSAPSLLAGLPASKDAIRDGSTRIYGALELVARAVAPIRGRKNLALFSLGFGEVDSFGLYVPDPRYYPPMVHQLNDDNVAVYAIDLIPTALGGPPLGRFLGSSLNDLAVDTGGRYYYTFVNFVTPLEQMSDDTNGYYLLSYTSEHPVGKSGYQKVKVRTVNPEFRVHARRGYIYGG